MTVRNIFEALNKRAPVELKMDFDNVGHLAGRADADVGTVLVALDITDAVIEEAAELGAELIVSHHPLIFGAVKSATDADTTGRKIVELLSRGIGAVCMHTNLDAAEGGVNDALAAALGAEVKGMLNVDEGVSRIAELGEELPFEEFLKRTRAALGAAGLRYAGPGRPVRRIGLCGGAGAGDMLLAFESGCDTYVTADVKHHEFIAANELGINLVDGGHFPTENVVVPVLAEWLRSDFPQLKVQISRRCSQPEKFFV